MAHRVTRRIEAFELDGLADFDHIARAQPAAHLRDLVLGIGVRQYRRLGGRDHLLVAAGVVAVLVRVEDLRDVPALRLGGGEAFLVVQRIDRQRLASLGAGDQIIEIAAGIGGPDLFDDHCSQLLPTLRNGRTSLGGRTSQTAQPNCSGAPPSLRGAPPGLPPIAATGLRNRSHRLPAETFRSSETA